MEISRSHRALRGNLARLYNPRIPSIIQAMLCTLILSKRAPLSHCWFIGPHPSKQFELCAKLLLKSIAAAAQEEDCSVCNQGFFLTESGCKAYDCAVGPKGACKACQAPSNRTAHNQCQECNFGYELTEHLQCKARCWEESLTLKIVTVLITVFRSQ